MSPAHGLNAPYTAEQIVFQLDTFRGGELVECQNFDLGGLTGVTDPVGEFSLVVQFKSLIKIAPKRKL